MRKEFAYTACYPGKVAGWALSGARYAPNLDHLSHSTKPLCRSKPQVLFIVRIAESSTSALPTMKSLLCTARPLLPRGTRCLKFHCWGQWSVDTPMDSVANEGKSRRLNRRNGQKFQASKLLSYRTLLKLIQSSKATNQNLSGFKTNTAA